MDKISGIYKIVNNTNGKYYVGGSMDVLSCKGRISHHKYYLKYNKHSNAHLQAAWNKYGGHNFSFFVVEEVPPLRLLEAEQKYLDIAKTELDKCYNLEFKSNGGEQRESSRLKRSLALKGRIVSVETRQRLRVSHTGKHHSASARLNMSKAKTGVNHPYYGKHRPVEVRKKISIGNSGPRNHKYDPIIYKWKNLKTGEMFNGTQCEFRSKTGWKGSSVNLVVKGHRKSIYDWIIK